MTSIMLGLVKRRTVSLTDEAADALDRIAKAHSTTVSGVVEAAGMAFAEGGRLGEALAKRGGPGRPGSGGWAARRRWAEEEAAVPRPSRNDIRTAAIPYGTPRRSG